MLDVASTVAEDLGGEQEQGLDGAVENHSEHGLGGARARDHAVACEAGVGRGEWDSAWVAQGVADGTRGCGGAQRSTTWWRSGGACAGAASTEGDG